MTQAGGAGASVPGGTPPRKLGDGGRTLEVDPAVAPVIHHVAGMIINGASLSGVARWLTDQGIPTPRETDRRKGEQPYRWWPATVRDVFRNRSLLGEQVHDGHVVRGPDGLPVKFPPILTSERFDRLQAALDALSLPRGAGRRNAAPLIHIAYCMCEQPLWATSAHGYRYYQCASRSRGHRCGHPLIRADLLEPAVDEALLEVLGPTEITERIVIPGDDHTRAKAEVGRALRDLVDERLVRGVVRADYDVMYTSLQTEHTRLSALPAEPGRVEERPTGVTVGEVLPGLDDAAKRAFLLKRGARVYATMATYDDWGPHAIRNRVVVRFKRWLRDGLALLVMVDTDEAGAAQAVQELASVALSPTDACGTV